MNVRKYVVTRIYMVYFGQQSTTLHVRVVARKKKVTLTIDSEILEEAKSKAEVRNKTLSSMVEEYLKFFARPWVYCLKCGKPLRLLDAEICGTCGWFRCLDKSCNWCMCSIGKLEDKVRAMRDLRSVYERLLGTSYDLLSKERMHPDHLR